MFMWWTLESHHASDSPIRCGKHLGLIGMVNSSRQVHRCKPYPEYVECYAQVVKELKKRDSHDKIQDREVTKIGIAHYRDSTYCNT